MTYTYALLEISTAAYEEIKTKLESAGYTDQFHKQDDGKVAIDMHGIALVPSLLSSLSGTSCESKGHQQLPMHPCPYQEEINEDPSNCCTCCDECQRQCADDI